MDIHKIARDIHQIMSIHSYEFFDLGFCASLLCSFIWQSLVLNNSNRTIYSLAAVSTEVHKTERSRNTEGKDALGNLPNRDKGKAGCQ